MSQFKDTIEKMIAERQSKIEELNSEINALTLVKFIEASGTYSAPRFVAYPVYKVPSRSGGEDHKVTSFGPNQTTCSCIAATVGRKCWARKGIEVVTYWDPAHTTDRGTFLDTTGEIRTYERI